MAPRSSKRKAPESAKQQTTETLPRSSNVSQFSLEPLSSDRFVDKKTGTKKLKSDAKTDCPPAQSSTLDATCEPISFPIDSVGEDLTTAAAATAGGDQPAVTGGMFKIINWNLAGIRAACKKGLPKFFEYQQPDIACFTEVKAVKEENPFKPAGYHIYWNASFVKKGYSGVALYSKTAPIKVDYGIGHSLDEEGRCIIAEYPDFTLALCYTPNAGENLKSLSKRMQWDAAFMTMLQKHAASGKPLIVTGDLNCAHLDFDVFDGETNKKRCKSAGFTPEERTNFSAMLAKFDFVDLYRKLYPDEREKHYTFFSHRHGAKAKNAGWRLDYFLASSALAEKVNDVQTFRNEDSSDHVPLVLTLKQ